MSQVRSSRLAARKENEKWNQQEKDIG